MATWNLRTCHVFTESRDLRIELPENIHRTFTGAKTETRLSNGVITEVQKKMVQMLRLQICAHTYQVALKLWELEKRWRCIDEADSRRDWEEDPAGCFSDRHYEQPCLWYSFANEAKVFPLNNYQDDAVLYLKNVDLTLNMYNTYLNILFTLSPT